MSDNKDNVKVYIRVRPLNDQEMSDSKLPFTLSENSIQIDTKPDPKTFKFDYIFSEASSQEEVFEKMCKPVALSSLSGYNSTVFAYGQTGAGKTFTILGPCEAETESNSELRGLLPRCFEYIFRYLQESFSVSYLIKCSYLEIYQEQINDLLDPSPQNLQIREDLKRGVYVEGLTEETVTSESETYKLLSIGTLNRHVASTSMNKESSRSHSVFTLTVQSKETENSVDKFKVSRFHLIDLAGSERQKSTDCTGERLKEAGMINKSLSALGNVINSLVDISEGKSRHIHYRDSKLTFLLKDSLGGNSKTSMIANISPSFAALNETISTLKFAQRAKLIKNSASVNEETTGTLSALQSEIKKLKEELRERPKSTQDLSETIESTLKCKQELTFFYENELEKKQAVIDSLKSGLAKLENKISHDKMVLKFRDATILRLQSGNPESEQEIAEHKQEICLLREQIENNPLIARMFLENEILKDTLNNFKLEELFKERAKEAEEVAFRLAENLKQTILNSKLTIENLAKEKEKLENELGVRNSDFTENELSQVLEAKNKEISELIKRAELKENELSLKENELTGKLKEFYEEKKEKEDLLLKINKFEAVKKKEEKKLNEKIFFLEQEIEKNQKTEEINKNEHERRINLYEEKIIELQFLLDNSLVEIRRLKTQQDLGLAAGEVCLDLQEKLESLQESLLTADRSNRHSEEKINYLLTQLKEREDLLNSRISKLTNINSDLNKEVAQYKEKCALLQSSVSDLAEKQSESDKTSEKIASLQSLLKEKNDLIDYYSQETSKYCILEQEHHRLAEKVKIITEKNESLSLTLQSTKHSLDESLKKSEILKSEQTNKPNYELLKTQSKDQLETITLLNSAKQELETKLQDAYSKLKELEKSEIFLKASQKDSEKTAENLCQELKTTKSSLDTFQELNLALTQKNAELSSSLGKMHSTHVPLYIAEQLRRELSEKNEELSSLKEENQQKSEILKTTKSSISSTKSEILNWRKSLEDKNQVIQELRNEVKQLKDQDSEVKFLRKALQNKENELAEIKQKGRDYYSKADEAIETMKKKCLAFQAESKGLKDEIRFLNSERDRFSALKNSEEGVSKKEGLFGLKDVNNKLSEELKVSRETNEDLRKQNLEIGKKLAEEREARKLSEEEIGKLKEGLAKITNFLFSLPGARQENGVQNNLRVLAEQRPKKRAFSEVGNLI